MAPLAAGAGLNRVNKQSLLLLECCCLEQNKTNSDECSSMSHTNHKTKVMSFTKPRVGRSGRPKHGAAIISN